MAGVKGRSGRKPRPQGTQSAILPGPWGEPSRREKRAIVVPAGVPSCPEWLPQYAKSVWRRTVPILRKMQLLSVADRDALAAYCHAVARLRDCQDAIQELGVAVPIYDRKGESIVSYKRNPAIAEAKVWSETIRHLAVEFGLTPSARERIGNPVRPTAEGRPGGSDPTGGDDAGEREQTLDRLGRPV